MSKTIAMSSIPGVSVIEPYKYPQFAYASTEVMFNATNKTLRTTQKSVSKELVESYRERIRNGEHPPISVGLIRSEQDPKKGFWYLYDGHHTYAAYRLEGIDQIPAYRHERGQEIGGMSDAPRYSSLKK